MQVMLGTKYLDLDLLLKLLDDSSSRGRFDAGRLSVIWSIVLPCLSISARQERIPTRETAHSNSW